MSRGKLVARLKAYARLLVTAVGALSVALALLGGAFVLAPTLLASAAGDPGPVRRPPVLQPAVPAGAPEELALWGYLERIGPLWGRDWPTVIRLFEEFLSRYPDNVHAIEPLYAAYIEDGKRLQAQGEYRQARARFEQATILDPVRGEAFDILDQHDRLVKALELSE